MDDLISRQAAIDVLHGYFDGMLDTDTVCPEDIYGSFECIPPAQPEPRTGKWVYNSPVTVKCDQCGFVISDWDCHRFNYCPNCGADTKGKKNE